MPVKCTNCGGAHPSWDCSKPMKSTAARKDVQAITASLIDGDALDARSQKPLAAGTQALPVDTLPKPKMGRPRTGYIKAEYNRQYSADQRAIKRLGLNCTVSQYRKSKGELI